MKKKSFYNKNKNSWRLLCVVIVTAMFLVACTPGNNADSKNSFADVPVKELSFPKADYYSILRIDDELIAFTRDDEQRDKLSYGKEGRKQLQHTALFPNDPNCSHSTQYSIFDTLRDDRVQVWKFCYTEPKTLTSLMAYDWHTHSLDPITENIPLGSIGASWNPDGTRAIVYLDDRFASRTLYWLWRGGFGPADQIISDDGLSWNLKDDFPDFKGAKAGTTGNTGYAAWSPDGNTIAFFSSPNAIGKTGVSRDAGFKLYLMDVKKPQPRPVLDGISTPYVMAWSSDSTRIAFVGNYGPSKEEGIWLYSLTSNSMVGIAKGHFSRILWDKDGKHLVAIHCITRQDCSQIQELDLSSIP